MAFKEEHLRKEEDDGDVDIYKHMYRFYVYT